MARTDRHFSAGARKRPLRHNLYLSPICIPTGARFACLTFAIVCQKPREYTKYSLRFCLPLTEAILRASRTVRRSDRLLPVCIPPGLRRSRFKSALFLSRISHFSKIVNQLNHHARRICVFFPSGGLVIFTVCFFGFCPRPSWAGNPGTPRCADIYKARCGSSRSSEFPFSAPRCPRCPSPARCWP